MGTKAEKALIRGLKHTWSFLDSDEKEMVKIMIRIAKSLPDEKILEWGRGKK